MTKRSAAPRPSTRNLVLVLGDQLDPGSAAFDGFDPAQDAVLQMEVRQEASYVPQHRLRIALFFAAMRHFQAGLQARGIRALYSRIDDPANRGDLGGEIRRRWEALQPERLIVVEPGDWRVREILKGLGLPLEIRPDRHFLCDHETFREIAGAQPRLVLERFYRTMRRRLDLLMDGADPVGGQWNLDRENRAAFGRRRPAIPPPLGFAPDAITAGAIRDVGRLFPDSPGRLDAFDYPVTAAQAAAAADDFVAHRLPMFGTYQDAMLAGQPFLFHARLSAPLNLHLLDPRDLLRRVIAAYDAGAAPLNAVEGFVRQVIGWREFVRGTYWRHMPAYAGLNALDAELPMPRFYWTGETDMRCLAQSMQQLIEHGYAHHIQRLMVLGLFALLLGVRPYDVHRWHVSMFADAIDWVSLPNTLGMSQHGDGGIVGTKPYAASGAYIDRMSDYCRGCRYDPRQALGERACPFTTLYWDFLARHRQRFAGNRRMGYSYNNLDRKDPGELLAIRRRADAVKAQATAATFL
ncbi:MAG: cryptochrome/photolyase family protein [Dongiaceae bacterium]